MEDVYESAGEAAAAIGVSRKTIQAWIKTGKLRAERQRRRAGQRGNPDGWRIEHADLMAARSGTMFAEPEDQQLQLSTQEAMPLDPMGLHVVWPTAQRHEPFNPRLFTGYSVLRAVTYSVSMPMILKMLKDYDYQDVEVVFGDEGLAQATSASEIMVLQGAIDEQVTATFVGMGGVQDAKTRAIMERVANGQVRFKAVSGSIVHTKLYLLENTTAKRILVGSANLSIPAFSGKQGEVLLAYDDDDWMWEVMGDLYRAIREKASVDLKVDREIKDPALMAVEDLPAFRQAKETGDPVDLYVRAPSDIPGSAEVLAARKDELLATFGPVLEDHLKPMPSGDVVITPAVVKQVKRQMAASKPVQREIHHHLTRSVDGKFLYDRVPIDRPTTDNDVARLTTDAYIITQYIGNYREFGLGAENLQRNYFAVMGWLYFSPFMSQLRRERSKIGPGNFDCKPTALIYGPSNCGKTDIVTFLFESMFGHAPPPLGDKDFTSTKVADKQSRAGLCPLFYDDISSRRFTSSGRGGSETMGENIVKAYDRLHHELPSIPCLIASLNSDAREFSNEVRKRALLVYTATPLPSDDVALAQRMEREAKQLHNRIDTAFYQEYLFRMAHKVDAVRDWADFDYLEESTGLLVQLFRECLSEEEEMPSWCSSISANEYNDLAWDLKRSQLKSRLDRKLYTKYFPPRVGDWTTHDQDIVLGVDDIREVMISKEIPDHLIRRETSAGSNLHLWRDQVEAFIRRGGDGQYKLPVPRGFTRLLRAPR